MRVRNKVLRASPEGAARMVVRVRFGAMEALMGDGGTTTIGDGSHGDG